MIPGGLRRCQRTSVTFTRTTEGFEARDFSEILRGSPEGVQSITRRFREVPKVSEVTELPIELHKGFQAASGAISGF